MRYRVPLPEGGRSTHLDLIEPTSTSVQRFIRREGLGAYEPSTAATVLTLCELEDDGFAMFDVGANMGLYGALAASMFRPAEVHCFEPAPEAASVASRIARRNSLVATVFEVAVSDTTGTGELQLSPVSDASNSMVKGFRDAIGTLTVPTIRLDDHVPRSSVAPDVMKIDVETHEPAVLRGARDTIAKHRPSIVIEVLRRRGIDHGAELTELMRPHGYHFYELSAVPSWEARSSLSGSGTVDRDWLMTPEPLDSRVPDAWEKWSARLSVCGADRNPPVPITTSMLAAYRRGGISEVIATGRRAARSRLS